MKNYFIGLDMGTDSIGWAVTDLEYNLLKDHGTDYWGSYLFDSAQTAVERRGFRAARRRTKRMHHRLMLLQELFKEEIAKVDPLFFIRLNNSNLLEEDKEYSVSSRNYLFDEKMFNDKEFFRKYPTIFHLRKTCLQGDITDIRLLYLAIHHIIKNRGHFLFEGQNFSVGDIENVKENFRHINNILFELYGEETDEFVTLPLEQTEEVLRVLENDKIV